MKLCAFTVCMPEYTPQEAAAKLSRWGFDGVEWRVHEPPLPGAPVQSFWNGNRCSIAPKTIMEQAPELRSLCRKHKLAMPVLASYLGYKDLDLAERVMEAAAVLGTKGVRIGVERYDGRMRYSKLLARTAKGWQKVVRLGEKYRVKPLAEIHMGTIIPSASAATHFAGHFSPQEMGIIHDAGNMVHEGYENWQMGVEILGRYLAHVHVKNASWSIAAADPDGNLRWSPASDTLRRGRVDWADVIGALDKVRYRGWLSLEDFGPGATDAKLKDDAKYLRRLLNKGKRRRK